ncbi:Ppx/GppA phosphatase family protein [Aeromicrobium duanguangcaii]|uniref:Ppx/GppA family phosphatase n=1 Tax=Aeromicrobium duanguangcaii TaxID=2968086 RepID=A0ABY5KGJ7_9ACTN|nr:Ppx/GppA phosphatase family protein [Aeromicrobium duanguangcaii]MCD9154056.1 Ppx/GppA family phosphatase [Aeromicrobium duanguangcaii]MCL3837791.1 Ppx/GppA family phosphatase [Aeromicrobium duanguangcaii]UUI68868.1 Ppx/GppA family phosphatase [Aeromicrobium duanguangcaii]
MRIGVLDIGSNTGHLLIVDAFRGGPPIPAHSFSEPLRLAENLDADGHLTADGIDRLVKYVVEAGSQAEDKGAERVLAFATSAVRDAGNAEEVIERVARTSGIRLQILPGEDEARLTFLAVRRWFGWSSGRLGVFDIGGGSLELAVGSDETPDTAVSLPLGAGRLTREWLDRGLEYDDLRREVRREIGAVAGGLLRGGGFDHAVATSKTFRSLARMCGAAPYGAGPYVRRRLAHRDLVTLGRQLRGASDQEIAAMPGVSATRVHQMRAGAMVAEAAMELCGIEELEICPWALREGVLIEYLDHL